VDQQNRKSAYVALGEKCLDTERGEAPTFERPSQSEEVSLVAVEQNAEPSANLVPAAFWRGRILERNLQGVVCGREPLLIPQRSVTTERRKKATERAWFLLNKSFSSRRTPCPLLLFSRGLIFTTPLFGTGKWIWI